MQISATLVKGKARIKFDAPKVRFITLHFIILISRVSGPDPYYQVSGSGSVFGIRIKEGKNDPQY
jgi:hypothetical protein